VCISASDPRRMTTVKKKKLFDAKGPDTVLYKPPDRTRITSATFDAVFNEESKQEEVYAHIGKAALKRALEGYMSTILAYGVTGSGKTHTMQGHLTIPIQGDLTIPDEWGIVPRILSDLFKEGDKREDFTVTMEYVQLYNDRVLDLGQPEAGGMLKEVSISGNGKVSDIGARASKRTVKSFREALFFYAEASSRRAVGVAEHSVSSRSHAVLTVGIEWTRGVLGAATASLRGTLYLVDLAGSEKFEHCGGSAETETLRKEEFACITRNLVFLGDCMKVAAENAENPGKKRKLLTGNTLLTRLLAPSLTLRGAISVIVTSSNVAADATYAHYSIRFAKYFFRLKVQLMKQEVVKASVEDLVEDLHHTRLQPGSLGEHDTPGLAAPAQVDLSIITPLQDENLREELAELKAEQVELSRRLASPEHDVIPAQLQRLAEQMFQAGQDIKETKLTIESLRGRMERINEAIGKLSARGSSSRMAPPPSQILLSQKFELERCGESVETALALAEEKLALSEEQHRIAREALKESLPDREQRKALEKCVEESVECEKDLKQHIKRITDIEEELRSKATPTTGEAAAAIQTDVSHNLLEDFDRFESDYHALDLQQLYENLPHTCYKVINLLRLRPNLRATFREIGGVRRCAEYMRLTTYRTTYRELAACLADVLDAPGREELSSLEPTFVDDLLLKVVRGEGEWSSLLKVGMPQDQKRSYLNLIANLAQHSPFRRQLAAGALSAVHHLARSSDQETASAALKAMGELAHDRELPESGQSVAQAHLEAAMDDTMIRGAMNTLDRSENSTCKEAAAKCLTLMCLGRGSQLARSSIFRCEEAVPRLLRISKAAESGDVRTGECKNHELSESVKYLLLLLLDKQSEHLPEEHLPEEQHMILLEALATASVNMPGLGEVACREYSGQAAHLKYYGHAITGEWSAAPEAFTAGGWSGSTYHFNPMYLVTFPEANSVEAKISIVLKDTDYDEKQESSEKQRFAFMKIQLVALSEITDVEENELKEMVSRGFKPFVRRSIGKTVRNEQGEIYGHSHSNKLNVERVSTSGTYLLVVSLGDLFQETRFSVSIFADSPIDVSSFADPSWLRHVFTGRWRPDALGFEQLFLINRSSKPLHTYCVLSYQAYDDEQSAKHLQDEHIQEKAKSERPPLEMWVFDISEHPTHRHVAKTGGKAEQETKFLSFESVFLHLEVPPRSAHALVCARRAPEGASCLPDAADLSNFRVQVLTESEELEVVPLSSENEWHTFSEKGAAQGMSSSDEAQASPLLLQLHGHGPQVVHFVAMTSKPSDVSSVLQVRRSGGKWIIPRGHDGSTLTKGTVHFCFELEGGDQWQVVLRTRSKTDFAYHVFGYSKFCPATLTQGEHVQVVGEPVEIQGCAVSDVNGVYRPTDEQVNGYPVYLKDGSQDNCLCFGGTNFPHCWRVQPLQNRGTDVCWAFSDSCLGQARPVWEESWKASHERTWQHQPVMVVATVSVPEKLAEPRSFVHLASTTTSALLEDPFIQEAEGKRRGKQDVQSSEDLREDTEFPARPIASQGNADTTKMVTVHWAFLERLYGEILRLRSAATTIPALVADFPEHQAEQH